MSVTDLGQLLAKWCIQCPVTVQKEAKAGADYWSKDLLATPAL